MLEGMASSWTVCNGLTKVNASRSIKAESESQRCAMLFAALTSWPVDTH